MSLLLPKSFSNKCTLVSYSPKCWWPISHSQTHSSPSSLVLKNCAKAHENRSHKSLPKNCHQNTLAANKPYCFISQNADDPFLLLYCWRMFPFFPKNLTPLITKSSALEEMCKKPIKTQHITPCLQIATKNILAANAPYCLISQNADDPILLLPCWRMSPLLH